MSDLPNDEAVEAAAKRLRQHWAITDTTSRTQAAVALAAALPLIREQIAQEIEAEEPHVAPDTRAGMSVARKIARRTWKRPRIDYDLCSLRRGSAVPEQDNK